MIRAAKSGFREASRRWSGADKPPLPTPMIDKPNVSVAERTLEGVKNVGYGIAISAFIVLYGLALPLIKLGLFHFLSWKAYKENGLVTGIFVFGRSCLLIDVGIIWGAVLVAQGKLKIWL